MNPIDLTTLIPRCHEASKANGWWEPRPYAGQQLMLVVSELSEALEADRTGKRANMSGMKAETAYIASLAGEDTNWGKERWAIAFRGFVKDSVEDELADAYIRLCDYAGGFELGPPALLSAQLELLREKASPNWPASNLGEALLRITKQVVGIAPDKANTAFTYCKALSLLEMLCASQGIDLATHIDLKLAYNATRGQKHGNKAY